LVSGLFSEEIIRYRYTAATETDLLARGNFYPEKDITAVKKLGGEYDTKGWFQQ